MALRFLPPPRGTGDNLSRPGLKQTEVRCIWKAHGRQTGQRMHPALKILRSIPEFSLHSQGSGDKRWRKNPEASLKISSTRADTVGDSVPGKSEVLATEEGVWGWLLSLFMAQKDPEFWDMPLRKDGAKMSDEKPLI